VAAAAGSLKYRVTNAGGGSMTFTAIEGGAAVTETDVDYGTSADAAATAADVVVSSTAGVPALGAENSLEIAVAGVSATSYTLTVQAWLDTDGGNDIDANEATSPVRTIEFVDHASVTGSVAITAPVIGATSMTATATLDGINYDQLDAGAVAIKFLADNVAIASTDDVAVSLTGSSAGATVAARTNPNVAAWTAATSTLGATFAPEAADVVAADTVSNLSANAAGVVYTAQLMLADHAAAYVAVTNALSGASAATGNVATLAAVAGANGASLDKSADTLRAGAGSVTVSTTATVTAGKSLAGNVVTFKIEEANVNELAAGNSFTAGGKTLTNSSATTKQSITVDVTTDALGVASLPIAYAGLKNADAVVITATSVGASAVISAGALTLTGADSLATAIEDNITGGELTYVMGSALSVSYNVVDQFGQAPVGAYRLVITENSSSANFTGYQALTNGAGTYSVTDNSTAANTYTLTATLQVQALDLTWGAANALVATTSVNVLAAAQTAATVSASITDDGSTTALALELDDTYVGNKALLQESAAFPSLADVSTVTYTVKNSAGAALKGAPITVTADKSIQLAADSDNVFALGTVSGTTNASGQFVVKAYSNHAGAAVLTATSGAATLAKTLTFASAKDDTATTAVVTAPTYVDAGTTFKVTIALTDKYGNPVVTGSTATGFNNGTTAPSLAVTYTGPGLIVGSLPTTTGAGGTAEFSVLLGSNDKGAISVTATYDANTAVTTNATVSATAASTIGSAPVTQKVNAGSFKGYVVVYAKGYEGHRLSAKVGKDWVIVPSIVNNQENGTLFRVVEFTGAGVDIAVRIYIDRVLVATVNLTTK